MKIRNKLLVSLLLLGPIVSLAADRVVLAVPARHDLVNFGFDLVGMFPRAIDFVCYDGKGDSLKLEHFNVGAGRWMGLPRGAWSNLNADKLILVGEGAAVSGLRQEAAWARQPTIVDGRRLHEVANAVNDVLRLSPAQWKRLANAYGFTLEDRNVEERRYGRYGPPSGRRVQRVVVPVLDPVPAQPITPITSVTYETEIATPPAVNLPPAVELVPVAPLQPEVVFQPEPQPARPETRPEDK